MILPSDPRPASGRHLLLVPNQLVIVPEILRVPFGERSRQSRMREIRTSGPMRRCRAGATCQSCALLYQQSHPIQGTQRR